MRKRLSCWFLAISMLLLTLALPAVAEGKVLVRMDSKNKAGFEIYQKEDSAAVTEGGIICTSSTSVKFYMRPKTPVPISRMDTTVRYRFKADMDADIDFVAIRIYGEDSAASTALTAISKPKSGMWYEGEFPLYKAKVSTNARQFKTGDKIKQIQLDAKNL